MDQEGAGVSSVDDPIDYLVSTLVSTASRCNQAKVVGWDADLRANLNFSTEGVAPTSVILSSLLARQFAELDELTMTIKQREEIKASRSVVEGGFRNILALWVEDRSGVVNSCPVGLFYGSLRFGGSCKCHDLAVDKFEGTHIVGAMGWKKVDN